MAQLNFNTEGIDSLDDFSPIPKGEYTAVIVKSEVKNALSGKGQYLALEFEIVEGKYNNRKLFTNLNIRHSSEKAQTIAQRELATICRAVGKNTVQDSSELHMKPMTIKVVISERKDTGDLQNEIKNYYPLQAVSNPVPPAIQSQNQNTTIQAGRRNPSF